MEKKKLVWEAKQYHLNIFGVSSTKCHGFDAVELNKGWKLFYSGVDVIMSAQVGVGIFVHLHLAHSVTDWISLQEISLSSGYRNGHCAFCRSTH